MSSFAYYVIAESGSRKALLAGPFAYLEDAKRASDLALAWLPRQRFRDTLGAFVEVAVIGVGRNSRLRRARFHRAIMECGQ